MRQKIFFTGLDLDSSDKNIGNHLSSSPSPAGSYKDAINIRVTHSEDGKAGVLKNMKGTVQIPWTNRPAGTLTCIGTVWDEKENAQIGFFHNSAGNHCIARYNPKIGTWGQVETVIESSVLNFDRKKLIAGAKVLDGRYLTWTDYRSEVRWVDIVKANTNNTPPVVRLYFRRHDSSAPAYTDRSFNITISDGNTTQVVSPVHIAQTADVKDFNKMIRDYASNFNGNVFLNPHATATACGDYIEIKFGSAGNWTVTADHQDFNGGVPGATRTQIWVYENRYSDFTEHNISLCFWPWNYSPTLDFLADTSRVANLIQGTTPQFAVVYHGWDNRRSVLSGYSDLAIDEFAGCAGVDSPYNCIEVDFTNADLENRDFLSVVKSVEILVRFGNNQVWKSVTILDHADFVYGQKYKFYNDGIYPEMDVAYTGKPHEAISLLAKSLEVVSDNENNTRVLIGGLVEEYDNVCADIDLSVTYDDTGHTPTGWTIRMPVYIRSSNVSGAYSQYQPIHDLGSDHAGGAPGHIGTVFGGFSNLDVERGVGTANDQWLPSGGFIFYLAGTAYFGISEQNDVTASVGGGTLILDKTTGNVYDTQADGGATNPLNRKGKAAVRYMIENTNGVFSWVEITGIPQGEYVLRAASHKCSHTDLLGAGTTYDLDDPERAWQKTSTYLTSIGGVPGNEVRITIPAGSGTLTLGDCEIQDLTNPGAITGGNRTISGYVIDNNADDTDTTLRQEGVTMERQEVVVVRDTVAGVNVTATTTDHNGFFFDSQPNDGTSLRVGVVCATGDPGTPFGTYTVPNFTSISTATRLIANDLNQSVYEGSIDTAGALTQYTNISQAFSGAEHKEFIIPNHSQDVADILRTTIEGFVRDSNGNGVAGVPVVFTHTGRVGKSGSDGSYKITVWADSVRNMNDREDTLIPIRDNGICVFNHSPATQFIDIEPFDLGADYSRNNPFIPADIIASVAAGTGNSITWKRRSSMYVGILYYDNCGRRPAVGINEKDTYLYIPGENEDLNRLDPDTYPASTYERGRPIITAKINHGVPTPDVGHFTHYRFVRTYNTLYNFYLQWVAGTVQYVERYDTAGSVPITTSYSSGTAREVYINVGNSLQQYKEENSNSTLGYTYTAGDRVRFIMDDAGVYFDSVYDLPIRGQLGDDIIVEALASMPEIKAGAMIEIYTPTLVTDQRLYYEFGPAFKINNPTTNPTHSVTNLTLSPGDSYFRRREVVIEPTLGGPQTRLRLNFENQDVSDFYASREQSVGRIAQEDHKAHQRQRPTAIRMSSPYISGSSINGAGEFEGLNIKVLNKDYGLIHKMAKVGDVLVSICENRRTVTTYMGKSEVKAGMPQGIITVVDQILGTVYELAYHAGTLNPESFVEDSTFAYWVDRKTGTIVRYTVNGIHPLESKYHSKSFKPLRRLDEFPDEDIRIYGTFDRFHREYIFSIEGIEERDQQGDIIREVEPLTMIFHEGSRDADDRSRFMSRLSINPEWICRQELRILSIRNGVWYLHNEGPVNEFYGVVTYPEVTFVANEEPDATKVWESLALNSYQDGWEVVSATNGEGQSSSIPAEMFRDYEGTFRAPFLRDITTPGTFRAVLAEGQRLRSKELVIQLRNTSTGQIELHSAEVYYKRSPRTNR